MDEHGPGLQTGFMGCRVWQTHHTTHHIFSNTRTVSLNQGPQYRLRQMWGCMGTEADRGCPSHGVSFLSLGRLESFPCCSKGAEVNTVFYLRDDTQGQVHEAIQGSKSEGMEDMANQDKGVISSSEHNTDDRGCVAYGHLWTCA